MEEKIIDIVSCQLAIPKEKINLQSKLIQDLGSDSLDTTEILMALEDEFKVKLEDVSLHTIVTVEDIIKCIALKKGA